MYNEPNFLPYFQRYFLKRKIDKHLREIYGDKAKFKVIFPNIAYSTSNPMTKTILLPPRADINVRILKTLAEHEMEHIRFRYPRTSQYFNLYIFKNLNIAEACIHIIEDNIVNEKLYERGKSYGELKKAMEISGIGELSMLSIMKSKEEKLKAIKIAKEHDILKEDVNEEELLNAIDKLIELAKDDVNVAIRSREFNILYKAIKTNIATEPSGKHICKSGNVGNYRGHGISYGSPNTLPDFKYVRKIRNIIKSLKIVRESEIIHEQFYGKKINRAYIHNNLEYRPFVNKISKTSITTPNILMLIDFSGSMSGEYERLAKTFSIAVMQEIKSATIIMSQKLGTPVIKIADTTDDIIGTNADGDEGFDYLPKFFENKQQILRSAEMFVLVSDLIIDNEELDGLMKTVCKLKIPKIIALTVDEYDMERIDKVIKKMKEKKFKIYNVTKTHETTELAKRLLELYK